MLSAAPVEQSDASPSPGSTTPNAMGTHASSSPRLHSRHRFALPPPPRRGAGGGHCVGSVLRRTVQEHARHGASLFERDGGGGRSDIRRRNIRKDALEAEDDVLRGLLARLALRLEPLLIHGGGRLGVVEDRLLVFDHVAGLTLQGLRREGDAPLALVLRDDHALELRANGDDRLDVGD